MKFELENIEYKEGKVQVKYGIKFERNHYLRQKAIEIHGTSCKVCGFNFAVCNIRKKISVNPETDLIPLCSNCHKMIHRKKPSL